MTIEKISIIGKQIKAQS